MSYAIHEIGYFGYDPLKSLDYAAQIRFQRC